MAFRFFRRIKVAPGLTVNLSKSGASLSIGPRGAKYTISPKGSRTTVGLPGTGLFYTTYKSHKAAAAPAATALPKASAPRPAIAGRTIIPLAERMFVEGVTALGEGDDARAAERLAAAGRMADALWLRGLIAFRQGQYAEAQARIEEALTLRTGLGRMLTTYGFDLEVTLPVTPEVTAHIEPGERGCGLLLVEIAQRQGNEAEALARLEALQTLASDDPVVLLSLVELALDHPQDRGRMSRVITLTENANAETEIGAATLLYRARALDALGLAEGAIAVLTQAGRRTKDRAPALLNQIRYDRAALYEATGQAARARREFERLYAQAPDFADVGKRLGMAG